MKRILITGANRGIGLEFTKQFLELGNTVYACCREPDMAFDVIQLKNDFPNDLLLLRLDLTSNDSISKLKTKIKDPNLNIIINNAGIFKLDQENYELNSKSWQHFFQINSIAPYILSLSLIKLLEMGEQKIVINISSDLGSIGLNMEGNFAPYRASKAALNAITKTMSIDLKDKNITVVAVHPGWVRTRMGGPNAPLTPEKSVQSMIRLIDSLTINDSGKYFQYDGKIMEW